MDRREILKASLASAASIGISSKRAAAADSGSTAGADGQIVATRNSQPVLASLYDFEAEAKRELGMR